MAYKARRTRDLQGEVKAGTGISVTESVNPDGTKVYTLENTAPGGGNEFEEVKIIDNDNNVKLLVDADGVHIYNDDENEVATLTKEEIILRDDENGYDKVNINRTGTISCVNSDGNETLYIDYNNNADVYIRNRNGNDGVSIETYEDEPATVKIYDQDGNEILNSESLVDMVNSASLWTTGNDSSFTYSSVFYLIYSFIWEVPPYPNYNDNIYFEENTPTGYTIDNEELSGLLVKQSGVYKINLAGFTYGINSGVDLANQAELHLGVVRNNSYVTLRNFATWANKLPNGASCTHVINFSDVGGIFELETNDVIVSYIDLHSSTPITGYSFYGDNPALSIQKIR